MLQLTSSMHAVLLFVEEPEEWPLYCQSYVTRTPPTASDKSREN